MTTTANQVTDVHAGELFLDKLLQRLLQIILENLGFDLVQRVSVHVERIGVHGTTLTGSLRAVGMFRLVNYKLKTMVSLVITIEITACGSKQNTELYLTVLGRVI